jgi:hypothetical protein
VEFLKCLLSFEFTVIFIFLEIAFIPSISFVITYPDGGYLWFSSVSEGELWDNNLKQGSWGSSVSIVSGYRLDYRVIHV